MLRKLVYRSRYATFILVEGRKNRHILLNLLRLAPNSRCGNIFIHAWFFLLRALMLCSSVLFEVNKCPSEQDAHFAIGFSLFVFRAVPYETQLPKYANVSILICVCTINLWFVWKVFLLYYFVFLSPLSHKWITVTYFATLHSWQAYSLARVLFR